MCQGEGGGIQRGWHNMEGGSTLSSKTCKILAHHSKQKMTKKTEGIVLEKHT